MSSLYHPARNGQAERAVLSVKESLQKTQAEDIEMHICRILLQYQTTPHTTTRVSTNELLMKRKLTTRLSRIHPDLLQCVYDKQVVAKERHDQHAKQREFVKRDLVFVCTFIAREKWITGIVQKKSVPILIHVKVF